MRTGRDAIDELVNLGDIESIAHEVLSPEVDAFVNGGAGDEVTLRDNIDAFARYRLRQHIGLNAPPRLSSTLLGSPTSMPIGIAPTADHGLVHDDAESGTARGARAAEVIYCVSAAATRPIEEIAAVAGPWWFQFYRGSGDDGIARAIDSGCRALALTADVAVLGHRDREFRAQRANPDHPLYAAADAYARPRSNLAGNSANTGLSWADIERIIHRYDLPVIVKGIMTAEDAARAVEMGAQGIWVSNHGARQLDRGFATLDVLEEVVDAVGGSAEVYLDGGVRRGADVVTALALGADAVFIGRPIIHGLAVAGDYGVQGVLEQYRRELSNVLSLMGVADVTDLSRADVRRSPAT